MNWLNNPSVWLIAVGVLVVVGVMVYSLLPKKTTVSKPPTRFKPTVVGKLSDISCDALVNHVVQNRPRCAIAVVKPETYRNGGGLMQRAAELRQTIDEKQWEYEDIFNTARDTPADLDDLGGLLLVIRTLKKDRYNCAMTATEVGEPIALFSASGRQGPTYNPVRQVEDVTRYFYNRLKRECGDYLVLIVTGPDFDPVDSYDGETYVGETELVLDDPAFLPTIENEEVEAYLSQHPSKGSVNRYTRHTKQQIHNVSSLNNAMKPSLSETIPFNEETRFQTPTHHTPTTNPDLSRYIRSTDSSLNLGGVETNPADPFTADLDDSEVTELE